MKINIRKATEDDSDLIAWAMLESSRNGKKNGLFDLIFDTSDDAELLSYLGRLTVTDHKSYCHFTNFLIAEVDGSAVGTLCGYEPRKATHEVLSEALNELGIGESYQERIASYLVCKPEIDNQTWVLDFLEEKPEVGSLEIMKELIQKSLLTARLKGYRKVQAIVEIGSVKTQMVYEKLGFVPEDEKRSDCYKELFGRAGIMRLNMQL